MFTIATILVTAFVFLLASSVSAYQMPPSRGSNRLQQLRMSSAPTLTFQSATILKNEQHAIGLRAIDIQVPDSIASSYQLPGQYCQIKLNGKPGFYAIRNPPDGRKVFSFIIKESPNNAPLVECQPQATFEMSDAQGSGFKMPEYFEKYKNDWAANNVLMLATGSGIAPIAAAIESQVIGLGRGHYNSLVARKGLLYIGAKTSKHLPCSNEFNRWEEQLGVKVVPVLSQPEPGWTGKTGYVQDALKQDGVSVPRNTGVLLCGQRGMVESAKSILLEAGVFEGRILLNF